MLGLFAALAVFAAAPATASATTPATPANVAPAKTDAKSEDKVVCHLEPVSGTRFARKLCVTAREAADRRATDRDLLSQLQDSTKGPVLSH